MAMIMQNITLSEKLKSKFTRIKFHLWSENTEVTLIHINQFIDSVKVKDKLIKFEICIYNN